MDEEQQLDQFGGQQGGVPQFTSGGVPRVPVPGSLYGTESFEDIYGYRPQEPKTAYTSSGQLTPHGRRVLRQQQQYDAAYKSWQDQQQAAAQAYASQLQQQRAQRDQYIQETTFARDMALKDQEQMLKAQMSGEVAKAAEILKTINPQDPNAGRMYSALATQFPMAMKDEGFNRAMNVTSAVHNDYMQSMKTMEEQQRSSSKEQNAMLQSLYSSGFTQKDIPKFMEDNVEEGRMPLLDPRKVAEGVGSKEYQKQGKVGQKDKQSAMIDFKAAKAKLDWLKSNARPTFDDEKLRDANLEYQAARAALTQFVPEVKNPSELSAYKAGEDFLTPDDQIKKIPQAATQMKNP